MKTCEVCQADKGSADFDASSTSTDGLTAKCKECRRAYDRAAHYRSRDGLPGLRPPAPAVGDAKACRDCGRVLPPDASPRFKRSADGRGTYCKPCHDARGRASKQSRHGGSRSYHLEQRHGITAADDDRMLAERGGLCALCRERPAAHVDHDHLSGRVRGLLCFCCNQGLGNFRDRADVLRLAVGHLQQTTWQKVREEPGVYRLEPPQAA